MLALPHTEETYLSSLSLTLAIDRTSVPHCNSPLLTPGNLALAFAKGSPPLTLPCLHSLTLILTKIAGLPSHSLFNREKSWPSPSVTLPLAEEACPRPHSRLPSSGNLELVKKSWPSSFTFTTVRIVNPSPSRKGLVLALTHTCQSEKTWPSVLLTIVIAKKLVLACNYEESLTSSTFTLAMQAGPSLLTARVSKGQPPLLIRYRGITSVSQI